MDRWMSSSTLDLNDKSKAWEEAPSEGGKVGSLLVQGSP